MHGSAKISSGPSESSAGSSMLSSAGSSSAGSNSNSSRGSGGSSSCECEYVVTNIELSDGMSGSFVVTNTGCQEVELITYEPTTNLLSLIVGDFILSPGESTTVMVQYSVDIRLTQFSLFASCGFVQVYQWPDFP